MIKRILLFTACVLMCALTAFAQQKGAAAAKSDNFQYWQMADKISKGDLNIDYTQLRKAFAEWTNKSKQTDAPDRDKMVAAFEAKNYAKAVELGEKVVPYELTNAGLLRAMADAYSKIGNESKSKFYTELAHKSSHSLFLSGDGKTAKTAYYVLGIPEEYRVMREFGLTVSSQSLQGADDGQAYDVLSGKDADGKPVEIYFNICIFFGCGAGK